MCLYGKSVSRNNIPLKVSKEEAILAFWQHLVYMWTKSFPHFFVHYESYFPDFLDSPFPSASGPFFREALHLKDTSAEEMEDYRKTELACRKFMHDAILFTKSVAYTDMNGETRSVILLISHSRIGSATESKSESMKNHMTIRNSLSS